MKTARLAPLALLGALAGLLLTSAVTAAEEKATQILPVLPSQADVGQVVRLSAYLVDDQGNPIPNAVITFMSEASFFNATSEVTLGRSRTDASGQASIVYTPRREGEMGVAIRFAGMEGYAAVEEGLAVPIGPGPQLYNEPGPFRIPGANVWTVAIILSIVWGLYLFAAGLLWKISREGSSQIPERG